MIIQKLLAPSNNLKSLYIKELDELKRWKDTIDECNANITFPISLNKGDIISFETYINAFPIEKWYSYTKAKNVQIVIRTSEKVNIQVYNSTGVYERDSNNRFSGKRKIDTDIKCIEYDEYKEYTINLKEKNLSGVIYPIIEAMTDCELLGGEYTSDTPKGASKCRICYIVSYNRDANTTRSNINAIINNPLYDGEYIVVCDMTGELSSDVFIDNSHVCSRMIQIPTSKNPGDSYNAAISYINSEAGEEYTHGIVVDSTVLVDEIILDRLVSFISLLDDVRSDMIIQGDLIKDNYLLDSSGYIIKDNKPDVRYNNFDLREPSDFITSSTCEEIDFFKFGVLCLPLKCFKAFNQDLRTNVELYCYLHNDNLKVTNLNGFFGRLCNKESRRIIWDYYYKYRDYYIAIVDSEFELDKTEYRLFVEKEVKIQRKKGNIEAAFAIIEAANDFLDGPEGLDDEYCLEEINERLIYLSGRFNDSVTGRKNVIRDRIELRKNYDKLCLKIDHSYDMIMEKWTEHKRKVDNEREQQ